MGGCLMSATWQQAEDRCLQHGARLCTQEELPATQGTGCGQDEAYVWTWNACRHSEDDSTPTQLMLKLDGSPQCRALPSNAFTTIWACEVSSHTNCDIGTGGGGAGSNPSLAECSAKCLSDASCKSMEFFHDGASGKNECRGFSDPSEANVVGAISWPAAKTDVGDGCYVKSVSCPGTRPT